MSRPFPTLPAVAAAELERCCNEGLNAAQTRLRLARCGVVLAERTVSRRMTACRRRMARDHALREIGAGAASVHLDLAPAAAALRVAQPDWRRRHVDTLRQIFDGFTERPTAEGYCALTTASYSLLVSDALAQALSSAEGMRP